MLALSGLCEGFARGVLSLRTTPFSVTKTPPSNSRVSISSKLIQTKALQVLYSGHLRKIGGRGSYRLVHAAHLAVQKGLAVKSSYSRTEHADRMFSDSSVLLRYFPKPNYSRTYSTPGGGGCTGLQVRPFPQLALSPLLHTSPVTSLP
jgi:hypothetical protein